MKVFCLEGAGSGRGAGGPRWPAGATAGLRGPVLEGRQWRPGPAPIRKTRRRDVGPDDGPVLYYLPHYYMILNELPARSLRAPERFPGRCVRRRRSCCPGVGRARDHGCDRFPGVVSGSVTRMPCIRQKIKKARCWVGSVENAKRKSRAHIHRGSGCWLWFGAVWCVYGSKNHPPPMTCQATSGISDRVF